MSAGCVFRNPEGASAGRLIDEAGCKGSPQGGERRRKHANFFLKKGGEKVRDLGRLGGGKKSGRKFGVESLNLK